MSVNSVHGVHSSALKDIPYLWFWEVRMESFHKVSEISNIQRKSRVYDSFNEKKELCGLSSLKVLKMCVKKKPIIRRISEHHHFV